ncbi:MAG: CsgG/HfaB family protein [Bryobacteraceae bacterium]
MKQPDVHKLLGGYATDTLTPAEREALFAAALEDQQLFEALADEQVLRDLLRDPAARQRVLRALEHQPPRSAWARMIAWFSPAGWRPMALAGGLATVFLAGVMIRQSGVLQTAQRVAPADQPRDTAASALQAELRKAAPVEPKVPLAAPPPAPRKPESARGNRLMVERSQPASRPAPEEEGFARERSKNRDEYAARKQVAGAVQPGPQTSSVEVSAAPAAPIVGGQRQDPATMQDRRALRLAVLGGQNYLPQQKNEADVNQAVQEMLAKKLDAAGQYSVVNQAEVDKAFKERNPGNKPVDAGTAASIGRSVGADTVIVANVSQTPATPPRPAARTSAAGEGAAGGFRPGVAATKAQPVESSFSLTAYAIDTRTESNVAAASTSARAAQAGGKAEQTRALTAPVDRLAAQLGQQLNRRVPSAIDVPVSLGGAGRITFTAGSRAGIRLNDRFDVTRDGVVIGQVIVTDLQDSSSSGTFVGKTPARVGDRVVSPK